MCIFIFLDLDALSNITVGTNQNTTLCLLNTKEFAYLHNPAPQKRFPCTDVIHKIEAD